jgi:hypothetical protein
VPAVTEALADAVTLKLQAPESDGPRASYQLPELGQRADARQQSRKQGM